jgi:hypothetical protein
MNNETKITEAIDNLRDTLGTYPQSARLESVTIVAGVRMRGIREPAVVWGMDGGDEPIPLATAAVERASKIRELPVYPG